MRLRRFSWPTHLVAALVLSLVATAAAPPVADAQAPKKGGTLRVSYGNDIANLDFHTAPGYEMMWVAMNVGCGLIDITPDGKFVGDAAESWQVAPDGLMAKGRRVAIVTDGRMSGASGKVPSAIHLTPEAAADGTISRLRDGDIIKLDAIAGVLEAQVDAATLQSREPVKPAISDATYGVGRELFTRLREGATPADEGASIL